MRNYTEMQRGTRLTIDGFTGEFVSYREYEGLRVLQLGTLGPEEDGSKGLWTFVLNMRVALRNEHGGVTRTVDLSLDDEGRTWQYAYDADHREQYPATAKSVQVAMRDGSWADGTILVQVAMEED